MKSVAPAEAKEHLGELVEEAAGGHPICITRSGEPVAQLTAVRPVRQRIDAGALRELTSSMTAQTESATEWMRGIRDEERC